MGPALRQHDQLAACSRSMKEGSESQSMLDIYGFRCERFRQDSEDRRDI